MYQIKAALRSKTDPTLGSVTIQFPIPWQEYDQVLERLKPLGNGSQFSELIIANYDLQVRSRLLPSQITLFD